MGLFSKKPKEPPRPKCQTCAGKGNVVQPIQVWNHQEKAYRILQRASACLDCGGTGRT